MTRKFFGTDGIRGAWQTPQPITADIALAGWPMAAGAQFTRGEHRHQVVIGKDTRLSGYMLEPALTAGFIFRRHGRGLAWAGADAGGGHADPLAAGPIWVS